LALGLAIVAIMVPGGLGLVMLAIGAFEGIVDAFGELPWWSQWPTVAVIGLFCWRWYLEHPIEKR